MVLDAPDSGLLQVFFAPLASLLGLPGCSDLCVNRPGEAWTDHATAWRQHVVPELDAGRCQQLATLIASFNAKTIDRVHPVLEAELPSGDRAHLVLPPACVAGSVSFTVRRADPAMRTLADLEGQGTFSPAPDETRPVHRRLPPVPDSGGYARWLDTAVHARANILIAGATGSGKTTLARALVAACDPAERLVTIEDVHELRTPHHPNSVHLLYRRDGGGGISARQALQCALRMRPDRILFAELRGDEAWDYVKSIHSGHPGAICTLHANGAAEALDQLAALVKDNPAGAHLDLAFVRQRITSAIDVVVYMEKRRVREVLRVQP